MGLQVAQGFGDREKDVTLRACHLSHRWHYGQSLGVSVNPAARLPDFQCKLSKKPFKGCTDFKKIFTEGRHSKTVSVTAVLPHHNLGMYSQGFRHYFRLMARCLYSLQNLQKEYPKFTWLVVKMSREWEINIYKAKILNLNYYFSVSPPFSSWLEWFNKYPWSLSRHFHTKPLPLEEGTFCFKKTSTASWSSS